MAKARAKHVEHVEVHVTVGGKKDVSATANLMHRYELGAFKKPAIAKALRELADDLEREG